MSITSTDASNSPGALAISDADSTDLILAAALSTGGSALPIRKPSSKVAEPEGNRGVDSGYASTNPSQAPTPNGLGGDSKRFVEDASVIVKRGLLWPVRKTIILKQFDKHIPKLTQDRFEDLREQFAESLNNLTRALPPKCRGILMSLKAMGESESTATPWVFIQCHETVAPKVRRFFKQTSIEEEFKPQKPDAYNPRFEIYVHKMAPRVLHNQSSASASVYTVANCPENARVYCEESAILLSGTLCGSRVRVSVPKNRLLRSATIGGLISIKFTTGQLQLLGLTAGHGLADDEHVEQSEDDRERDFLDDLDDEYAEDEPIFELDPSSLVPEASTTTLPLFEVQNYSDTLLGHIYKTAEDDLGDQKYLDWALFTIEDSRLYLPNIVRQREITHFFSGIPTEEGEEEEEEEKKKNVVMRTAKSGLVRGTLTSSASYLMLAPGKTLITTHALTLSDRNG
jgi:hypothetical protein